jgi:hypothetical protein
MNRKKLKAGVAVAVIVLSVAASFVNPSIGIAMRQLAAGLTAADTVIDQLQESAS